MKTPVLVAQNLGKVYRLYDDPLDRLKEALHPLRKKYHRDFHALHDVSFSVNKGETLGILGKNGSGKSTLLKILTGVLTPTAGCCSSSGRVLALLELGTGFNPELTGIENIYFNGMLLGASRKDMDERLEAILNFADIGDFVYQPVKTYSSGMYVRLAFAVIANMDADILIIDEALSVGDAFFVQKCMRFLRRFMENGTLVFVSHDMGAVTSLCERVVWLDHGCLKKDGSSKEVTEAYLADLYEEQQGADGAAEEDAQPGEEEPAMTQGTAVRDMRHELINGSNLRNDIEIFCFNDQGAAFGKRGAEIVNVHLSDAQGNKLSWCVGGEEVVLVIRGLARQDIGSAVIGFVVKDRLGQAVFSDNTFLSCCNTETAARKGQQLEARFCFCMPVMPKGDYSISAAIAEGTQNEHIQHHWLNDALIFKIQTSMVCQGVVGIPMQNISLTVG
ncbi:ABC transporter ATP-binding protein [uncultured Desulfuromonas sp.]|uniref:ABC transporter ATP-binding protein n=1 Tax=uncultured Desulfuromonas sp. TaxID=181013 RepID=UPI002AAB1814|nr:ABC transporter ATP-binding protein [uncultured Desulfuromonas sp.]